MPEWDIPEDISQPLSVPESEGTQGEDSWFQARVGYISASRISEMLAGGKGVTREKYLVQLAIERLTGIPSANGYKSSAMFRGNEIEPEARDSYNFINDVDAIEVGFIKHPVIDNFGASPDGCIGSDGLIEIKCPDSHVHIGYMLNQKIPTPYVLQMQTQLACTGRKWVDFCSYNKDMPPRLRLFIMRVNRDEEKIRMIEKAVVEFDNEISILVEKLRAL